MKQARGLVLLVAAGLIARLGAVAQSPAFESAETLMATWWASVRTHQPGESDAALAAVSGWSRVQWSLVYPRVLEFGVPKVAAAKSASDAELWKRAALLHSDIAHFAPTADEPTYLSPRGRSAQMTVRIPDGRFDGVHRANGHWQIARVLLDRIPASGNDTDVRDWYRATSALMASWFGFADLGRHLQRAGELFPADSAIHFNRGCLYEALGSPRVQDVVATLEPATRAQVNVDNASVNHRRAEEHFGRVTADSPLWPEAQVRRARVRFLLGQTSAAVEALRTLAPLLGDPWVRYHALMFLGQAEETLGRTDAARSAYQDAAALYPGAQSPHVALAAVDAQERAASTEALHRILRLPPESIERADPWTDYYRGEGRRADALLDDVHSRFRLPESW